MNGERPKISVIVPTYNRAHMLGDCIRSVLSQEFGDFELIIVSDGSIDDTETIVRSFKDPRVFFIKKQNGGQASARNLGIANSRGEYISFCDDDDRFYPEHLNVLTEFLDLNQDMDFVYSDALWVHKDGSNEPRIMFSQEFDKKELENFNYVNPQTVLFRRHLLSKSGVFDEDPQLKGLEDWDLFLRLSDYCSFRHLRKTTVEYLVHTDNSFQSNSGYDYNRAFLIVRTKRFHYLSSKYGSSIFDHVDHMYPFHLAQCYINNKMAKEALDSSLGLYQLYKKYLARNILSHYTLFVIVFALGISSFFAEDSDRAETFFRSISENPLYRSVKDRFARFVHDYTTRIDNTVLKTLLKNHFPVS